MKRALARMLARQHRSISILVVASFLIMAVARTLQIMNSQGGAAPDLQLVSTPSAPSKAAYVFYASNNAYCCAAIVNMARLRRFTDQQALPEHVDLVLIVSDEVSPEMQRLAKEEWGAVVYNRDDFGPEYAMAGPLGKFGHYYKDCFQKFLAFLLPADVYKRLVVIDADCLILRPPHHLFDLPKELPLAAPPAYWYWNRPGFQDTAFWQDQNLRASRQVFLTTWFMSIRPSIALYRRLQRRNDKLVQEVIRQIDPLTMEWYFYTLFYRSNSTRPANTQRVQDVYDMDLFNAVFGEEVMALPAEYALLDLELTGVHDIHTASVDIDKMLNGTQGWAIHFSAGKPMKDSLERERYPQSHPAYNRIIDMWYREAEDLCPAGSHATAGASFQDSAR